MAKAGTATAIDNASNDAENVINFEEPYSVTIDIVGTAAFLFHRYSCDAVEAQAKAKKGSQGRKYDDLESYVYRTPSGHLAIPSEQLRMALCASAKSMPDPRSPRKSAVDLFKAGIIALEEYCSVGVKDWDYVDRRRVVIQRSAVTRQRPALLAGWKAQVTFQVLVPEYITPDMVNALIQQAGRLNGVGDFRPTFGRFQVVGFKRNQDKS